MTVTTLNREQQTAFVHFLADDHETRGRRLRGEVLLGQQSFFMKKLRWELKILQSPVVGMQLVLLYTHNDPDVTFDGAAVYYNEMELARKRSPGPAILHRSQSIEMSLVVAVEAMNA